MLARYFDLQGHRGARGLKPENTIPSFETAFDLGLTSIETDVHLSRDSIPVLIHEPWISNRWCRQLPGANVPDPSQRPLVSQLTLAQLRGYAADRNPDPQGFPNQNATIGPLARLVGERTGVHPYAPPTLDDLFDFVEAYTGEMGTLAGKTRVQQERVQKVRFDLELKRVPYRPEFIGDTFDGQNPGCLESQIVAVVRSAWMVGRSTIRSFDHRSLLAIRKLEPGLAGAVLVEGMVPISPAHLSRQAGAQIFCPQFEFLDQELVRQLHAEGIRIVPWTVNTREDCCRLLDWGIDGLTTDFPDRVAELLKQRGIPVWRE
jgi:glycerophosphoryl diester phosphodiesterase